DELGRCGGRAARSNQVVDDQVFASRADRVRVHFEMVRAVLELILRADGLPGQLAALAYEVHLDVETLRERRTDDEAAGLDREQRIRLELGRSFGEMFYGGAKRLRMSDQRRDVLEQDAGFRKVRHVHDQFFDLLQR